MKVWAVIRYYSYEQTAINSFALFQNEQEARYSAMTLRNELCLDDIHKLEVDVKEINVH